LTTNLSVGLGEIGGEVVNGMAEYVGGLGVETRDLGRDLHGMTRSRCATSSLALEST
jgi:hypothetical protein